MGKNTVSCDKGEFKEKKDVHKISDSLITNEKK